MPKYNDLTLFCLRFVLGFVLSFCLDSSCWAAENGPPHSLKQSILTPVKLERGAQIFEHLCLDCHGDQGQGVEGAYERALTGDDSVGQLAKVIADTMPEDDAEACVGEDASAVAAYVFESFYSPAAQVRNNPPQIRLARLTANQLRQSLADIYGRFDNPVTFTDKQGIRARYFNRDSKDGSVQFDRVDPVLDFDFGTEGPGQGINPKDYSINWNGALRVDVTGRYELILRSTSSFVFFFGSKKREFINNYVQSENKTEFRKSILLTSGRVYPFSIQLQQRKRKTAQPPVQVSLSWKAPHGVERIVPAWAFANTYVPATFALQAKLPPDDRSYGYERGIAVDRQWDESTTAAAIEFAELAIAELWPRYRRKNGSAQTDDRVGLREFLVEVVETAFRGPLPTSLRTLYIDDQLAATEDDAEAIKRVLLISLKSPRFLYPLLDHDRTPSQRAANRLALTLFDSLPSDPWLRQDAAHRQLQQRMQVRDAANRMLNDWRVRGKTRQLMYEWLNLGHIDEISKDENRFPQFDAALVSDLRDSLDRFLDDVIWSDASDFRRLFSEHRVWTTPRLAEFYGEQWQVVDGDADRLPNESGSENANESANEGESRAYVALSLTKPDPEHSFGVLSHPLLMSGLAYQDSTSPIHRGVFLMRYILGRTLRPPNEAFTPLSPALHPDLTTRERVSLQTSPENCQACHTKINGLGFLLEQYDAVGRYQTTEQGRAIDASGRYITRQDDLQEINGAGELAAFLADSPDVHRAFVKRAFQHFVKQPPAAYGLDTEDRLLAEFTKHDFSIRKLLIEIAVTVAIGLDEPPPPAD